MTQKHYKTAPEDRIPLGQKIAFGAGMLGNQMFPASLSIFMVVLVKGLGMDPMLWGILFFLPRMFDAITDPIMGFISDNTNSQWGRRRPYVFIGAIIAGLSFIAMWQVYPENGEMYNFTYFISRRASNRYCILLRYKAVNCDFDLETDFLNRSS